MLPLFVLAVILSSLAIYVWQARPYNATNRWFAALTASMAGWVVGIGGLHSGIHLEMWGHVTFAAASFLPAAFLAFVRVYPARSSWPSPRVAQVAFLLSGIFAIFSLATPLVIYDVSWTADGLTRKSGPLYLPFAIFFLAGWLVALALLTAKWRRARGLARVQLQYLVAGLIIATVGGITPNLLLPLLTGQSAYAWVGPYLLLPLMALVGHAIIRHRLLDIRVVIHRTTGYVLMIAGASTLVLGLAHVLRPGMLFQPVFLPVWLLLTCGITALILSPILAPRLGRLIDKYTLRERTDYAEALRDAAHRLALTSDPENLARSLRSVLEATLVPEMVTLVLQPPGGAGRQWLLAEHLTDEGHSQEELERAAWNLKATVSRVQLVAQLRTSTIVWESHRHAAILLAAGVEVWIGLERAGQRLGVLLLGPRRSGSAYLAQEFDFLEALADLGTIAFEASYLYRRQLEVERQREREGHLARMARIYAGLTHEIRTPLTTISNLISLLPDRYDDPEFRELMVRLVPGEVARIATLAGRLRSLTPDQTITPQAVALRPLLEDVVSVQAPSAATRGIKILLDVPDNISGITGVPDALVQLFQNLIQNAIDASREGGTVWLRASMDKAGVCVQVVDEGTGIDPAVGDRIFEEFVTTKPTGLGLGLSICCEIAKSHEALLRVENRRDGPGARAEVIFPHARGDQGSRRPRADWSPQPGVS